MISIECRPAHASDIRAPLVRVIGAVLELNFSQVDSAFMGETGRVDVTASVTSHKRRDLALEAIVGRFADLEGVVRASWRLNPQGA
jgi:hypothetical protein